MNLKENFKKFESTHDICVDGYVLKTKAILYLGYSVLDKIHDIDDELWYDCDLNGIAKVYFKNGDINEEKVSTRFRHSGTSSYSESITSVTKDEFGYIMSLNIKRNYNRIPICNLKKIELYWIDAEIEVVEYDCKVCGRFMPARSDEPDSCEQCGGNCCKDCLIYNEYLKGYVCPDCYKEYQEEVEDDE